MLDNVISFPQKQKEASSGLPAAEWVKSPSRSETLIKTLDALLDNMVNARGPHWTSAILDNAWARQMERLGAAD